MLITRELFFWNLHTLSQPTRRRANTANGKEGLKQPCRNLQDQKVHRYFGSSQLGTSRNQPLCTSPEMSNTRYHSLPDAGQTRQMARRGSNSLLVFLCFFGNLQDQKVHRYFRSSQLGTSWNQPLCSTPRDEQHTLSQGLPDAGQTRQMARRSLVGLFLGGGGIYKTKRYIDTLGVHSWEPPGTSRYAQHQR